jgi:hypothetical protein
MPLTLPLPAHVPAKGKVVNGYDDEGGLWFSREVLSGEAELHRFVAEAHAVAEVTRVEVE